MHHIVIALNSVESEAALRRCGVNGRQVGVQVCVGADRRPLLCLIGMINAAGHPPELAMETRRGVREVL